MSTPPQAPPAGGGHHDHVSPYDRLAFSDTQVQALLASGERAAELVALFGEAEYAVLLRLQAQAENARALGSPAGRVIIVPGMMGSQLGLPRPAPHPADLLWIDPADIIAGRLAELRLGAGNGVQPMGAVLHATLRLKLQLLAAGYDAAIHDYDWRLGVDELGAQLADRLQAEPHARVSLVAHSMGGLVARAALARPGTGKVNRVVLLGTPSGGTFASVQALRGVYPVVRHLAGLDAHHSAEQLAQEVFGSFAGLCQLLPARAHSGRLDLFDARHWPGGPCPGAAALAAAAPVLAGLPAPDARFVQVVGVGQVTTTGIARRGDDFIYTVTRHGDGTVPAACATLPGVRTWYARVRHGELSRDLVVARTVVDLLRRGATSRLRSRWQASSRARAHVSDAQLRQAPVARVDWAALTPQQRGDYLRNLSEAPQPKLVVPGGRPGAAKAKRAPRRKRG